MKNSHALNLGLILGAISVVLYLISAMIDPGMMMGMVIILISLAVTVALTIMTLKKKRAQQGGLLSFKEGFVTSFVGMLIGGAIYLFFNFVYANFLDSNFIDRTVEKTLEISMGFMEGNVPEDLLEEQMITIEEETRASFTFVGTLLSLGKYAIFYAILGLIFGASMKKTEPTFEEIDG